VGKRTQAYRLGFPERYFTQGDDSAGSDKTHSVKMKARQIAYKEGKKVDLSKLANLGMKVGEMKKGGKVSAKPLSATVKKTLQDKAKSSGKSYSTLVKVYRRGQGAWMSGGSRKGAPMAAWAMGRVNSFIKGSKKHDTDL
tara:strand:+ start:2310 stop:2729 length:420 start_codon:yes stop_codon:yes gene_type:complete